MGSNPQLSQKNTALLFFALFLVIFVCRDLSPRIPQRCLSRHGVFRGTPQWGREREKIDARRSAAKRDMGKSNVSGCSLVAPLLNSLVFSEGRLSILSKNTGNCTTGHIMAVAVAVAVQQQAVKQAGKNDHSLRACCTAPTQLHCLLCVC